MIERGIATDACPFRHRTRYYDSESWLYYYGYRYYDPSATKWISKDPLGETGGWNLTCFCDNDPVNGVDPTGLEILYSGTEEEIALLKRFREAISKGSLLGKALMDRLDEKGFTVTFQFGPPPGNPRYIGQTVRGKQFGTRSLQISSSNKEKTDRPLYSSDVYLNKTMFRPEDGKTDLNLAFATIIHESVHAYDLASRADLEPEKDRPELTRLFSFPKGVRGLKDVEAYGKISGWTSLFDDSDPNHEYRAIRGVRGIRTEAGDLYSRLIKEGKTSLLENAFGKNAFGTSTL